MKRLSTVSLIVVAFVLFFSVEAQADSGNPPVITSVTLLNPLASYSAGDVLTFEMHYSGGNPGLQSAELDIRYGEEFTGAIASYCLEGSSGYHVYSFWNSSDEPGKNDPDWGLIAPGVLHFKYVVSSYCPKGNNYFYLNEGSVKDKTELNYTTFQHLNYKFQLNITDGLYVPIGSLAPDNRNSTFNFDFLNSLYQIDDASLTSLTLPKKTPEGVLIDYFASGYGIEKPACHIISKYPHSAYNNSLSLDRTGTCVIQGNIGSERTGVSNQSFSKTFKVITNTDKAAADKAAADKAVADKAAADKAAADNAAADKAAADKAAADKAAADKAAADKAAADKAAADKAAADALAAQQAAAKALADKAALEALAAQKAADAAKAAALKKITITCIKGKLTKTVTAVKPTCPAGYKKK